MKYENSFYTVWTDGGSPSAAGYFDGAGEMNGLLLSLFAGRDWWRGNDNLPFYGVDVMGNVSYGTPMKVTVILEEVKHD